MCAVNINSAQYGIIWLFVQCNWPDSAQLVTELVTCTARLAKYAT